MAIGLFFLILAILLAVAMPVGGVFGLMAMLPNLLNPASLMLQAMWPAACLQA